MSSEVVEPSEITWFTPGIRELNGQARYYWHLMNAEEKVISMVDNGTLGKTELFVTKQGLFTVKQKDKLILETENFIAAVKNFYEIMPKIEI